jgi:fructose-1,6-bisphosphatase
MAMLVEQAGGKALTGMDKAVTLSIEKRTT